ncbi:MAG: hypothetical protein IPN29_06380 [Saprospiraceae bacterium]|nr:hypothetical protein [Saprospiraceae bacterium]
MKLISYILGVVLCSLLLPLSAQHSHIADNPALGKAKVKVVGTGNTTGHIANLSVENPTLEVIKEELNPLYIPSTGKYQPYVVPYKTMITVNPNATTTIPLHGYCVDIYRPPVPEGESMPPINSWLEIDEIGGGWTPQVKNGWRNLPGPTVLTALIPGSDVPLGHSIDGDRYPEEVAPLLLSALENIAQRFDSLKSKQLITTPFSGNPEKERESVIQQTFWIFVSLVSGHEYKKEVFSDKMTTQFEKNKGISIKDVPNAVAGNLHKGVDDFWSTFELVGTEAKIMTKKETSPKADSFIPGIGLEDIQPKRDTIETPPMGAQGFTTGDSVVLNQDRKTIAHEAAHTRQSENKPVPVADDNEEAAGSSSLKKSCECKKFKATLECNRGLQRSITMENDFSKSSEIDISSDASFDKPKDVRKPEEFTLSLKDISLECNCGESKCEKLSAEKGKNDKPKYKVTLSSYQGVTLGEGTKSSIAADSGHSFDFKATEASSDVVINFRIDVYCSSDSCRSAFCKSSFRFTFSN